MPLLLIVTFERSGEDGPEIAHHISVFDGMRGDAMNIERSLNVELKRPPNDDDTHMEDIIEKVLNESGHKWNPLGFNNCIDVETYYIIVV